MPLQKAPPNSSSVTNEIARLDQNVLRERRRTLQTISELSSQGATITDTADVLSREDENFHDKSTVSGNFSVKSVRRRSLPSQGVNGGYDSRKTPSILVTPTEAPPLRRSLTDPVDRTRNAARRSSNGSLVESHRLSSRSSSRRRHPQDLPLVSIAEGALLDPRSQSYAVQSPQPYFKHGGALVKQLTNGPSRQNEGWNARRERERILREQAIVAARTRREKEQLISTGSPSSLPSMSPMPMAKAKEIYVRRQGSQKHSYAYDHQLGANRSRVTQDQRTNYSQAPTYVNGQYVNQPVPRRASYNGYPLPIAQRDMLQRSHSATTVPSWAYHANSTLGANPHLVRTSSSQMLAAPPPQDGYQRSQTMPNGSLSPSPNSTCSSNQSSTSHSSGQAQPASSMHANSGSRYYVQHQASNGRLEVFPALADVQPPLNKSQSVASITKQRRTSQSSQSSRRASFNHLPIHPQSQPQQHQSPVGHRSSQDIHSIIHRENPDKRGLLQVSPAAPSSNVLRKRERTVGTPLETRSMDSAKTAKEQAREKIRERVKRANELEDEKEKELVEGEKKNKRRSFLCGLFER